MWHRWHSADAFDAWHNAVCATLGIPYPGRNAATGEVDESAQWTTAYVEPVVVADDDVRCWLPDFHVEAAASGAVPCDPPPVGVGWLWDGVQAVPPAVEVEHEAEEG